MKKVRIEGLLIAVVFLTIGLTAVHAQSGSFGGGLTWRFNNGTLTIGGSGPMPDHVETNHQPWHAHQETIAAVVIGDGVTAIGKSAFQGYRYISSVTIGSGVTSIGVNAFASCAALKSITIPDTVTFIDSYAFYECTALATAVIGSGVTRIPSVIFARSGLTSITIPEGITNIDGSSFTDCSRLTTVYFNAANCADFVETHSNFTGCVSLREFVFGDRVRRIPNWILNSRDSVETITIGKSVIRIGDSAFWGCAGITSITIPGGVTEIGGDAFRDCTRLASIAIPDSVTEIGFTVFYNCAGLRTAVIGSGLSVLPKQAFSGSGLTEITIPEGITRIDGGVFQNCSRLKTVYWNASNCSDFAETNWHFYSCASLTEVVIGDNVRSIPNYAFIDTSVDTLTIGRRVSSIGIGAFWGCANLIEIVNNAPRPQQLHYTVFTDVEKEYCTLEVPASSRNAYMSAEGWKDFQFVD